MREVNLNTYFYCPCGSYFSPGTYTVILVWRMMLAPANTPIAAGSMMRHWSVAHRVDRDSYTGRTLPRQEWGRPSWPTTSRDALTSDTLSCFQDGTACHKNMAVSAKQNVHVKSHVFISATIMSLNWTTVSHKSVRGQFLKITVIRDLTSCNLVEIYGVFRTICNLHRRGKFLSKCIRHSSRR